MNYYLASLTSFLLLTLSSFIQVQSFTMEFMVLIIMLNLFKVPLWSIKPFLRYVTTSAIARHGTKVQGIHLQVKLFGIFGSRQNRQREDLDRTD